jgi:hypothetical protein
MGSDHQFVVEGPPHTVELSIGEDGFGTGGDIEIFGNEGDCEATRGATAAIIKK